MTDVKFTEEQLRNFVDGYYFPYSGKKEFVDSFIASIAEVTLLGTISWNPATNSCTSNLHFETSDFRKFAAAFEKDFVFQKRDDPGVVSVTGSAEAFCALPHLVLSDWVYFFIQMPYSGGYRVGNVCLTIRLSLDEATEKLGKSFP